VLQELLDQVMHFFNKYIHYTFIFVDMPAASYWAILNSGA